MQASQHSTADGLGAIDKLKQRCEGKKRHRQAYHFRILWVPCVDECSHKLTRVEKHDESHDRHEGPAHAIGSPSGANDALMISRTIGKSHPDGRCLSEPQRYHEAHRRDLNGDGMCGKRGRIDQAHEKGGGVEGRDFEGQESGDREPELQQTPETRPIRFPEMSKQAIPPEPAIDDDDEDHSRKHQETRQGGCEPRSGDSERRQTELAEDEPPIPEGIERDRHEGDNQRPARSFQCGDERPQHDVAVERQYRPLQAANVQPRFSCEPFVLAHQSEESLGVP